jgi:leader peptidase (prepilin peptidase)/N-methyltransferase
MLFGVAIVAGVVSGLLANLLAETLPRARSQESSSLRFAISHYLTLPWHFFRGGVCPHCGERRPLRAPLLELAVIAAFALIAWQSGGDWLRAALFCLYAWFLLVVLVIDLEHRLVLNVMTGPAAVLALAASFLPGTPAPLDALIGGAGAFAVFFLIALVGRGAMGMGDVKLAGVIGLMLGYPLVVPALLAGVILGGIAAAIMLITKRATRKTAIAYAPYLCLGALAMLILMV